MLAARITRPSEVFRLVDEATCRITAEDVNNVEALAQSRNAGGSEGKGVAGVTVATCVFLDFWKEAKRQELAGCLLAGPHVAYRMHTYILRRVEPNLRLALRRKPQHCKIC